MFMGEVAVQIITEEWPTYWSSWLNRIDLIVCVLCVFLYIIFASVEDAPHNHYSIGNYMDALIVGIRYGMQAIRLLRFAQRGRENRQMLNQTEVKFNNERTLSVLHLHGVQKTKKRKKKEDSDDSPARRKSVEEYHYASSLRKWSHNMNKLFNPNFNVLLYGVNSNELRGLKERSDSIDNVEMVGINGKTEPHGTPPQDAMLMDSPQISSEEDHERQLEEERERSIGGGAGLRNRKSKSKSKSKSLSQTDLMNGNDLGSPITPENVHFSEAYTTDDVDENQMNQMGFMYDSEQMALYDNILQNEETDDTVEQNTPNTNVLV